MHIQTNVHATIGAQDVRPFAESQFLAVSLYAGESKEADTTWYIHSRHDAEHAARVLREAANAIVEGMAVFA